MCGLSFILDTKNNKINPSLINNMIADLDHRGPDGSGKFIEENYAFGHTRLSITDLTKNGEQPFFDYTKNYAIIYNGELYNTEALKQKLKSKNTIFKSSTDTEVLLYCLIHFGEEIIKELNGMFVFIFLDKINKKLIIARDRYGIKPLYYSFFNNKLFFSSEIKPIINNQNFNKVANANSIVQYFTFQNIFTNDTFFEKVKIFPSASFSIINLDDINHLTDENLNIKEYWDFEFNEVNKYKDLEDASNDFENIFSDVIERQSNSPVQIGSYLSGGVDSSLISLFLSKKINNLKTFSCGFKINNIDENQNVYDETLDAKYFAQKINSEHFTTFVNDGDMRQFVDDLVYTLEDPLLGQSYPNFIISKFASSKTKIINSGAGSDELFCGYPWRYIYPISKIKHDDYYDFYYKKWQRLTSNNNLKKLFKLNFANVEDANTKKIMIDILKKENFDNDLSGYLNRSLYFELKTFLKGLLTIEDKISMRFGLETRLPFLDNDLVDLALKCPIKYKIKNTNNIINLDENLLNKKSVYIQSGNESKLLLRNTLKKHSFINTSKKNKQGFTTPDIHWFKNNSKAYLYELFFNKKDAPIFDFFERSVVQKTIEDHVNDKVNSRLLIWSFIVFNSWIKQFL